MLKLSQPIGGPSLWLWPLRVAGLLLRPPDRCKGAAGRPKPHGGLRPRVASVGNASWSEDVGIKHDLIRHAQQRDSNLLQGAALTSEARGRPALASQKVAFRGNEVP